MGEVDNNELQGVDAVGEVDKQVKVAGEVDKQVVGEVDNAVGEVDKQVDVVVKVDKQVAEGSQQLPSHDTCLQEQAKEMLKVYQSLRQNYFHDYLFACLTSSPDILVC